MDATGIYILVFVGSILLLSIIHRFISNQNKIMAQLTDIGTAIGNINAALQGVGTEISNLKTELTNSITPDQSDILLQELQAIATGLQNLLPPQV